MKYFVFKSYEFNPNDRVAAFHYAFDDGREFTERVTFETGETYDKEALERALTLSWLLIGTSYYKCFPVTEMRFESHEIDAWQAEFLNTTYQEGMSQFAFENQLTRDSLARFVGSENTQANPVVYGGEGILALQSGGKDSLLMAQLLEDKGTAYDSFYISSGQPAPQVLQELGQHQYTAIRKIDIPAIKQAQTEGGLNGHVPVTYIVLSLGLVQAILAGKRTVVASIGHEGEEPHGVIGDLEVNHQWSKTWPAELLLAEYVARYVSPDIQIGSPLRSLSEFRISELFVQKAWERFGRRFSSCNLANYKQGADNAHLTWCGECPKCANAYLLFSPFVSQEELKELFGGKDLFAAPHLVETFKGLLGVDGVMKPFECIGEVDELRYAYQQSQARGFTALPFAVPGESTFDQNAQYPAQAWTQELI